MVFFAIYFFVGIKAKKTLSREHNPKLEYLIILGASHFGLLKRTAKKNKIELFKVTSGAKKMENALKLSSQAVYNIKNKIHIKNRLSCHKPWGTCEFYKTKHCR